MDLIKLPFDISCLIFSQLDQKDIIQCMHVSRPWLNHVPSFSHKVCQQIAISLDESENPNKFLLHFLGPHVTHLRVLKKGIDVHGVLRRFCDYNITSLEILYYDPLNCCHSDDDGSPFMVRGSNGLSKRPIASPLLTILRNSFKHLTHFTLVHYSGPVITLYDIMESCFGLTHLTLSTRQSKDRLTSSLISMVSNETATLFNDDEAMVCDATVAHLKQQTLQYATRTYPHLIYLHIDHEFDFDSVVLPFVQKCPRLAHIRFSIFDVDEFNYVERKDAATHVGRLLDVSSSLYSFAFSNLYTVDTMELLTHTTTMNYGSLPATKENNQGNLHTFILNQDGAQVDGPLSVLFKKAQKTLTVLDIKLDMFDFYRISNDNVPLAHVHLPCLAILRLACLDLDPDWIAGLLRQCPVLEEIMLWQVPDHITQSMVDAPCIAAGGGDCRLLRFHLTVYLSGITADPPPHRVHLNTWVTSARRLEEVELWNVYPNNQMLYCLSQIPSLKKFSTNHRGFQASLVTTQGLLAFATELSSGRKSVSQLQELRLEAFKPLTDNVMKALAGMDSLKNLHICRCPFITDEGIKLFVDSKKPGSLEKLSLSYCRRVTPVGIDYAISILGASKVSFLNRWLP